jgi:hypothetical protein
LAAREAAGALEEPAALEVFRVSQARAPQAATRPVLVALATLLAKGEALAILLNQEPLVKTGLEAFPT